MEEETLNHGEISLAHLGVLFLDEILEFKRDSIETLRGPLEDRKVTINRANWSITYPCKFMLIASMNPCPCGYYGSKDKKCNCTPEQIRRYINRISGPILDRIDIHIEVEQTKYRELNNNEEEEHSSIIKQRVNKARTMQIERYKEQGIYSNSELSQKQIEQFCKLTQNSKKILEMAFNKLKLSARAYSKILKVARTIADLDNSDIIQEYHITEAIQYRSLDRKYWNN